MSEHEPRCVVCKVGHMRLGETTVTFGPGAFKPTPTGEERDLADDVSVSQTISTSVSVPVLPSIASALAPGNRSSPGRG